MVHVVGAGISGVDESGSEVSHSLSGRSYSGSFGSAFGPRNRAFNFVLVERKSPSPLAGSGLADECSIDVAGRAGGGVGAFVGAHVGVVGAASASGVSTVGSISVGVVSSILSRSAVWWSRSDPRNNALSF
jgi:hypothetical protein